MPHRRRPIRAWRLPEPPSRSTGQAAFLEQTLDHELVCTLGALPLLVPLFERLGLREVINRRCQPTGTATTDLDLGLVTLVLVLNRLLAPKPLVHVETWLAETALPDLLGLEAAKCNDDRLARALDALAPHLDALWQDLIVAAIMTFDLDLSRLCYDITSVSFCGDYEQAELIRFGYSRDHRPDRKQLELAATVTAVGGVPTDYRVLAGNVADRTTPIANLRRVQALLAVLPRVDPARPPVVPLVISDRAMLTAEALAAYEGSGVHYLGPLDPGVGGGAVRALLEEVPADELAVSPRSYRPRRAADDPSFDPYHGVERELWVRHPQADRPPLRVRALVVWSPGKARLDAQRRQTDLSRLEADLADLATKVGRRPYTTVSAVQQRVTTLLRRQRARALVAVTADEQAGRPTLSWTRDEAALAAAAALDGRYVLGTNAPHLDPDQMLAQSKERDVPEKRFATVKGPLAVRPVYLHTEARILSLVFCTMVALLTFALLELLARRAGLTSSGRALLQQFASLAVLVLVFTDGSQLRRLTGRAPPLADTLAALGLPPAERYLTVHD